MRHSVLVQRRPAWRRPRAALHAVCPIAMKSLRTDDWKQRLQRINGRVRRGCSGLSIDCEAALRLHAAIDLSGRSSPAVWSTFSDTT